MTEEGGRPCGDHRARLHGREGDRDEIAKHGRRADCNGHGCLRSLVLRESHAIQRAERPLLTALLAAELRLLRDARFGAPDNLFARVLAKESRGRRHRRGDDGQECD